MTPNGGCSQSSGNAVTCIIRGASVDLSVSCKYEYFLGSCLVAERRYIFAGEGRIQVASKKVFTIGKVGSALQLDRCNGWLRGSLRTLQE